MEFHRHSSSKDGYKASCKICRNLEKKCYRSKNREKCNNYNILWQKQNPKKSQRASKKWKRNNSDKVNAINAARRAAQLQRTPKWLSKAQKEEIRDWYRLVKELQWLSHPADPLEVDHIVPLQSEHVSGLHVPWNLQILTESEMD